MSLTNDSDNQAAEAIYFTHRSDFIVSCLKQDSKVKADFCDLHALLYKNMWDKFDPNYESDLTKEMKALVAEIDIEEDGFYMAPGKTIAPSQIVPSAWTKKPKIVTESPSTPAAIRAELKRTEDSLAKNMTTELQKITANHEQQIRTIEENHRTSMNIIVKKLEELQFHYNQQGNMINDLLMRNDNDQAQMTEGFAKIDKIDKNVTANEVSIEHLCHDTLTAIETNSKGQQTVTRALQQGMETTAKSFKIIADEILGIKSEIDEISHQGDLIEEALERSCEQVDYIFKSFEEQSSLHRGRDKGKGKRNRSRSASSNRSTVSNTTSRWSKKRQTEIHVPDDDSMSGTGDSLSHSDDDDNGLELDQVQEEDDLDLSELEREDAEDDDSDESMAPQESTVVSGSPQDAGSRRD